MQHHMDEDRQTECILAYDYLVLVLGSPQESVDQI